MGESSFWYRPTRVVPDQRPLNGRCCCCCCCCCTNQRNHNQNREDFSRPWPRACFLNGPNTAASVAPALIRHRRYHVQSWFLLCLPRRCSEKHKTTVWCLSVRLFCLFSPPGCSGGLMFCLCFFIFLTISAASIISTSTGLIDLRTDLRG